MKNAACLIIAGFLGVTVSASALAQKTGGNKTGGGGPNQSSPQGNSSNIAQSGNSSAFFETQMLAYGALEQIGHQIAQRVCTNASDADSVVIFDQATFQNLQAWQAFQAAVDALTAAYWTVYGVTADPNQPPPSAANAQEPASFLGSATAAPATPSSSSSFFAGSDVSGLISAVSASTTNTLSSFSIPDSAMATSLLRNLKNSCPGLADKVIYFPLFGNSADLRHPTSDLNHKLARVNGARAWVQKQVNAITAPTANDPRLTAFTALNADYDQLMLTLTTSIGQNQSQTPSTSGPNPGITSIVQGAQIARRLYQDKTYVLYANVIAAGGTQRDRKNLFTIIFTGDLITYSGGLIVNYALTRSHDDKIVDAALIRYRTPFTRVRDPFVSEKVVPANSGDDLVEVGATKEQEAKAK